MKQLGKFILQSLLLLIAMTNNRRQNRAVSERIEIQKRQHLLAEWQGTRRNGGRDAAQYDAKLLL
jgi:hypothetical protein